jgi:hypothetical protein
MKRYNIKSIAYVALMGLALTSCEDYLDKPTEDGFDTSSYYSNDDQVRSGVNYLYNSPWYDFQRGFIKVGECLSGNAYMGSSPYMTFTLNGDSENLADMSASLWAVNTHAMTVYSNIKASSGASEEVKNACMGEALTWKAFAYFYMVRTFGAVPIIHDPVGIINAQQASDLYKAKISNVYDYIIMTLEKAIELLPEKDATGKGRIDKYCAKALLAKVYLTKSGFSEESTKYNSGSYSYIICTAHQRNADDLKKAADLALDVIENSGRQLMPVYSDIFRGKNNVSDESLIAWAWTVSGPWTVQNSQQSDQAPQGFGEFGDNWGEWSGVTVDLMDAFGENPLSQSRQNTDDRRKATIIMPGDHYDYFLRDEGGLEILKLVYQGYSATHQGSGKFQGPTGGYPAKHLVGDIADHEAEGLGAMSSMHYGNYTHLLRLADVYLIYCEAVMGNATSTTDAKALEYFYQVRHRSVKGYQKPTALTWEDVWKERRLELAYEGDRWYDYVRLYYYNPQRAIDEITAQRRNSMSGLDDVYKAYYNSGYQSWEVGDAKYNESNTTVNVTDRSFTIPMSSVDIQFNDHLMQDPQDYDVSTLSF